MAENPKGVVPSWVGRFHHEDIGNCFDTGRGAGGL